MSIQPASTWFLQRNIKEYVSNEEVQANPGRVLRNFLWGHVCLTRTLTPLSERNFYGGRNNRFQVGEYSYNLVIVLPLELRRQLEEVIGYRRSTLGEEPVKLSEVKEKDEFTHIFVPPEKVEALLPYLVIHGGLVNGNEQLHELYVGEQAKELLANAEFREEIDRTNPSYRK